ncbi:hypothetical protein OH799_03040 [Nocardia sp. NBC_00881]|uniref:hypothetical protein n=1 Tax=Nocardia sp. NBC_00881 TaxID=2975995 RepID=UPI00386CE7AE|nr:hypothetical protein OH799_03040 [Nocardia sp. NBC_00881]
MRLAGLRAIPAERDVDRHLTPTGREVPVPPALELIAELWSSGTDLRVAIYPGDHLGVAREAIPDACALLDGVLDRR